MRHASSMRGKRRNFATGPHHVGTEAVCRHRAVRPWKQGWVRMAQRFALTRRDIIHMDDDGAKRPVYQSPLRLAPAHMPFDVAQGWMRVISGCCPTPHLARGT